MSAGQSLSREQLVNLTGYRQPARMVVWLVSRNWVFEAPTRRGDIPKVSVTYYEHRMTGRPLLGPSRRATPRLDFLAEA